MSIHYQRIALGGKVYYPTATDRSPEYEAIFPETARGLSILDLACNTGFYALRAAYEGASRVVAVERNGKLLRRGTKIAEENGLPVQFVHGDMCQIKFKTRRGFDEKFDVVLCMNVLHYFPDIEVVDALLARIDGWARQTIVFINLVPTGDEDSTMTKDKKGRNRLAISAQHIFDAFPDFWPQAVPSRMRPHDRLRIKLTKQWVKDNNWM